MSTWALNSKYQGSDLPGCDDMYSDGRFGKYELPTTSAVASRSSETSVHYYQSVCRHIREKCIFHKISRLITGNYGAEKVQAFP
jgi:hypothetical protein